MANLKPCKKCGPAISKSGKVLLPHQFGYYSPFFAQYEGGDHRVSDIWVECPRCNFNVGECDNGFKTEESAEKAWNITNNFRKV